jgi:molecular chaperone GrpE
MSEKDNLTDDENMSNDSDVRAPLEGQSNKSKADEIKISTAEIDEDQSELEQAEAKALENWDLYLRALAELENVRKRAKKDIENAHKFALERFSRELLAVRDSLEMGLTVGDSSNVESFLEGTKATLKILNNTMQQFGIEEVDPAGEPFDPEYHEAISMQSSNKVEPGSVVTVMQKGYSLNGRLLRPAMVVVAED